MTKSKSNTNKRDAPSTMEGLPTKKPREWYNSENQNKSGGRTSSAERRDWEENQAANVKKHGSRVPDK
jgi:hypothetical protein